jgi:class 3 adenylate cyclase
MAKAERRTWVWWFDQPPERLWPLLADTPRFNEAMGLPKYQVEEIPRPDGTMLRIGRGTLGRYRLEWEELPFQWAAPHGFAQSRLFRSGPFSSLGPTLELTPERGGSRVSYTMEVTPANVTGWLLLRLGFLDRVGTRTGKLIADAAAHVSDTTIPFFSYQPPPRDAAVTARAADMVLALEESGNGHGLAQRLADHLLTAQEVDLIQIRPLALARAWSEPPRPVIELCLGAVRTGLLTLRWNLLCPRCRGAKATAATLDRLPNGAHCPSCNIDYGRDFTRNVELTFQPAPAIRPLTEGEYCLAGPMTTPHVEVQQTLEAAEVRRLSVDLPAGAWRLRTLEPGGSVDFDWDAAAGAGFPLVITDGNSVTLGPPGYPGSLCLENRAAHPLTLVVERRDWVADALTAHQVTALQAFRDMFSDEVLRPGDEVAIGTVTLMFTDLKGSTALYDRVGDARAFHMVREHFAMLAKTIREHDGAIVKTIGDAVMAAFTDPAQAVRAALEIQTGARDGLTIKLGLHSGACVAVTLNGRLDYFGSTVNLAARLEGLSQGGDIVLSDRLACDPAVSAVISSLNSAVELAVESAELKGFGAPVSFRRLVPDMVNSYTTLS